MTDEDVLALGWERLLTALELAFTLRASDAGAFLLPERVALQGARGTYLTMPCADRSGWFGVKQVSVLPDNPGRGKPSVQAWYTLFDPEGAPALALDAGLLTRLRTAAVSALAARYLAAPAARRLLVIGTGTLAPWLAEAHAHVRDYAELIVWGRDPARARVTAASIEKRLGREVGVGEDLATAAKAADLIAVATSARRAIVRGSWLRPGQHLDLVGAFLPDMAEADAEAVTRADVYVDDRAACQTEAGDLVQAQAQGWSFELVHGDLAEVVTGRAGRQGPGRITLFKSVGLALEDLAVARLLIEDW